MINLFNGHQIQIYSVLLYKNFQGKENFTSTCLSDNVKTGFRVTDELEELLELLPATKMY